MTTKPLSWDGDRQFAVTDITIDRPTMASMAELMARNIRMATSRGLAPSAGISATGAMTGNCSRCNKWTRKRRVMAFEPSDPRAYGSEPGMFRTFYFTLCPSCTGSMTNAEQREWAKARALDVATENIGASGRPQ